MFIKTVIRSAALAILCGGLLGPLSLLAAHPLCSSSLSDVDGDGWGWENDRSCVVATESLPPTTAAGSSGLPACANASSDADGDGYGWERERSCIVVSSSQSVDSSPESISEGESAQPDCISATSDPDGDGYGWENNRTCLVTANSAAQMDIQTDQVQPAPAESSTTTLRFMALGDSITHGVASNSAKSYRHDLTRLLDAAGCSYTMVGSQQANLGHRTFVSPHEGYNGHRADHFLTGLNNFAGNNEGVSVAVNRHNPDLVLLHLGTNDMLQNQNVENTVAEIDQVISIILSARADILVANVIPVFGRNVQARIQQLGDQLHSYVAQLGNSRVKIVDVRSGFTNSMMLSDNLHPNTAGEAHIARAFFNAVRDSGNCVVR